jgi:predicted amidohydrolase YtcJ
MVAMGDEGIQVSLDAIEQAGQSSSVRTGQAARHRLDHAYIWKDRLLHQAGRLGVIWNTQPPLLQTYSRRSTLDAWGPERAQLGFPFRSAIEAGVIVSGGSDAPVATPNPLVGLDCLLTHRLDPSGTPLNPAQTLSLEQALRVYTYNGAFSSGEEDDKGSLEVGKLADLVVLSGSLSEAAPDHLPELTVELTMLAGQVVYEG